MWLVECVTSRLCAQIHAEGGRGTLTHVMVFGDRALGDN